MAKPSFPFYPDDWMNDLGLRGCSPASRGIWADILCLMHQGVPYGHLADSAGPLPMKMVAQRCGVGLRALDSALEELAAHNVFSRTEDGTPYSRRMVRDEHNRMVRGQGGSASLRNHAVPRPKGIHEGILPAPEVKVPFGPEEVKDKPSFEEVNESWKWFQAEYPGEVNPFTDMRLFISVMETRKDLAELRENLPLWKETKRWKDGFWKSAANFLSERLFKIKPKVQELARPKCVDRVQLAKQHYEQMRKDRAKNG